MQTNTKRNKKTIQEVQKKEEQEKHKTYLVGPNGWERNVSIKLAKHCQPDVLCVTSERDVLIDYKGTFPENFLTYKSFCFQGQRPSQRSRRHGARVVGALTVRQTMGTSESEEIIM